MGVPHLLIPFQLDATGSVATIEQGTVTEVAQCVRTLLSTPTGTRIEQFDYGIPDMTFSDERSAKLAISLALRNWEPRAVGSLLDVTVNDDGTATVVAQLPASAGGTR